MNTTGQIFGGDWTEQKLDCVRKYLHAYTTIMSKQRFEFAYIDAFAGTGYREVMLDEEINDTLFPELDSQEVVNFRQGSARYALEVQPPFEKYIFIEEDQDNYTELQKLRDEFLLKEEFSEDSIECKQVDANEYLREACNKNWQNHRALVFLDPFGMQVEWETIKLIADTKAIDLWLLFPIGTVNRLLKRNGDIRQSLRQKLNLFFGEDSWFEVFYELAYKNSLFGEEERWEKVGNIFTEIEQYFMERLQEIFAGVATNPLSLRNSKNVPLYLLCFAAGNPRGSQIAVKIAQDILLKELR
jgi:three-Cys-motif partner protein